MRKILTKSEIDALTCPPGRRDILVFDIETTGLLVRVTEAGRKIFMVQYRAGGKLRRSKLGQYGKITLHEARTQVEAIRTAAEAGGDPIAEGAAKKAAAAAAAAVQAETDAFTVAALLDRWQAIALADRAAHYRYEAPRGVRNLLGKRVNAPARSITRAEIQKLVDTTALRVPVQAMMARNHGRAAYNWAMKRGYVETNPFAAVIIERRMQARDRVLSDTELAEAWRAAGAVPYPFGPLVQLMILTMQRRGEVAGMSWTELSPDLATWTIPRERAKNGRTHVVHLVEPARAILRQIPRAIDSDLVFTTTGRPVSGFKSAKALLVRQIAADASPGAKPERRLPVSWVLHDFRRTGVTKLAELGIAPHIADRILNHVAGTIRGVMATYQRFEFLPERQRALELWGAHVLAVATGAPADAGVIEFPRKPVGRSSA